MVLKNAVATALCTGLLMSGGAALADEYRADEFLGLDLSQAVLSPKRLGPETQFAPVRIEARTDRRPVKTERVVVAKEAAPTAADRAGSSVAETARAATPPAPSWRGATAIRSTHRRATRGSRHGRASPAPSAAGSGRLGFVGWVERSVPTIASAREMMGSLRCTHASIPRHPPVVKPSAHSSNCSGTPSS